MTRRTWVFGFLALLGPIAPLGARSGTGLEISVAVDTVAEFKVNEDSKATDALNVREAELSLYAPIDHRFDGVLSMAAHRENGVSLFEIHEATISSNKLVPGLSARAGQYFLGVGRLNRVHRHDWPFIKAPKFFTEYFDSEGIMDTGFEASYLFPTPFYFELTAGVTNGWTFGHSHHAGEKPKLPTHYARIGTFIDGGDAFGLALGANYIGRRTSIGDRGHLFGLDGIAKGEIFGTRYLVQTETWLASQNLVNGIHEESIGSYIFPQVDLSYSFKAGVRLDYYSILSLTDAAGERIANADYAFVPTLTYVSSEFASFKLAYNHAVSSQEGETDMRDQSVEFQMVFILGAHPAHDF